MILADISVVINVIKNIDNEPARGFRDILTNKTPFSVSFLTYHELLQGAKSDAEYDVLEQYLDTLRVYHLPKSNDFYKKSSQIYRAARKRGKMISSAVDVLIAAMVIWYDLTLLHNDKGFISISSIFPEIKIHKSAPIDS